MPDPTTFEARLQDAFDRYADAAPVDVNADALAAAIAEDRRSSGWATRTTLTVRRAVSASRATAIVLVALLLALLLALQLLIAGAHRIPPPFGVAGNGLIGFELAGDVYVGDVATGTQRLVAGGRRQESAPAFSPDGTRIALIQSTDTPGEDHILVVGIDGSDPTVVTPAPLEGVSWVDWTPDSRQVVIVARVATKDALLLADATKPGVRTIVDDVDVEAPVFRPPDGREVMFRAMTSSGPGLFVSNLDGSNRRALIAPTATSNELYHLRGPRYSPDGSRIAYMAWDDERHAMRTWVMNADGTAKQAIAPDPRSWFEGWPVWSPDGTRLILIRQFVDATGRPNENDRPFAVAWVDGRAPTIETGPPMTTGFQHAEWSPDGRAILVQGNDQELLLDPAGGPWRPLPWTTNTFPAWQRVAP